MKVLYVYPGKLSSHGLDLVARQHLQAFAESSWPVECLARGRADFAGVQSRVMRYTPANLISFLPAALYYGAQHRFFDQSAAHVFHPQRHHLVVAFEGAAETVFRQALRAGVPTALICPMGHALSRHRNNHPSWPAISLQRLLDEYTHANRIFVRSPRAAETFLTQGFSPNRLVVVPGGVDANLFYPTERSPDGPFRLLFCGRLSERKGIRQVIQAWKTAALPPGSAELWLAGAEPNEIRPWLDQVSSPDIRRLGFVQDVAGLMRQCDAQILLSDAEGMPKSLVEGACSGLATLATPETGFPIREGVTGWTVPRENIPQVAQAIQKLASNRNLTKHMGQEARREALALYTWPAFRRTFIAGLRPLLADNSSNSASTVSG